MTSPWSDGIASDLESPKVVRFVGGEEMWVFDGEFQARMGDWDTEPREPRYPQQNCDCADCRAIVALVEEETIDKP